MRKYVGYIRVSTQRQGQSGLGLEAQRYLLQQFVEHSEATLIREFVEVESGRNDNRVELAKAIALVQETGATLLIAKLDRLSRRAAMIFTLRDFGVKFICADLPEANEFTIGILAVLAQYETSMISQRTREGLAAAKRRGVKMGCPCPEVGLRRGRATQSKMAIEYRAKMLPIINQIRTVGGIHSAKGIARCLNARGLKTIMGKTFTHRTIALILKPITPTPHEPSATIPSNGSDHRQLVTGAGPNPNAGLQATI